MGQTSPGRCRAFGTIIVCACCCRHHRAVRSRPTSVLAETGRRTVAQKEEVIKQLGATQKERNQSNKDREQSVKEREEAIEHQNQSQIERDEALAGQKEAMQLVDRRNTQLQASLKERDEAMAKLSPQLAANVYERARAEYRAGRISEAMALLAQAYEAAPVDNPFRIVTRRLIVAWSGRIRPIDLPGWVGIGSGL